MFKNPNRKGEKMSTPEQMRDYQRSIAKLSEILNRNKSAFKEREKHILLGDKFVCAICGQRATKPKVTKVKVNNCVDLIGSPCIEEITEWDKPGDMQRCASCHQWVCNEHIHDGMCNACAKK